MHTPTRQIILAAIEGFEGQKLKIDAQIAQLRGWLEPDTGKHTVRQMRSAAPAPRPIEAVPPKPHKQLNARTRKRMAAAQRKRRAAEKLTA
jgi:hypothetical protein